MISFVHKHLTLVRCPQVSAKQSIAEAGKLCDKDVFQIAVVAESGLFLGMLSAAHLLQVLSLDSNQAKAPISTLKPLSPLCLAPASTAEEAMEAMMAANCNELPVVSEGRFMGLVRLCDLVGSLRDQLTKEAFAATRAVQREVEQFVSHVAHDIRSPLSIALSCCEMLERRVVGDQEKKFYEMIRRSAKRTLWISDSLLQLERYGFKKKVNLSTIDLAGFLEEIRAESIGMTSQYNAEIVIESCYAAKAKLDPLLISRAMQNLIDNACKHSHRGGKVFISIGFTSEGKENYLELSVRDQGIGIEGDHLEDIFEPFIQLDDPEQSFGYGLGLAVAKRFSEMHGGHIKAEKVTEGGGAKFIMTIPFLPGETLHKMPDSRSEAAIQHLNSSASESFST